MTCVCDWPQSFYCVIGWSLPVLQFILEQKRECYQLEIWRYEVYVCMCVCVCCVLQFLYTCVCGLNVELIQPRIDVASNRSVERYASHSRMTHETHVFTHAHTTYTRYTRHTRHTHVHTCDTRDTKQKHARHKCMQRTHQAYHTTHFRYHFCFSFVLVALSWSLHSHTHTHSFDIVFASAWSWLNNNKPFIHTHTWPKPLKKARDIFFSLVWYFRYRSGFGFVLVE